MGIIKNGKMKTGSFTDFASVMNRNSRNSFEDERRVVKGPSSRIETTFYKPSEGTDKTTLPATETGANPLKPSNKPNDYDMGHHSSFENNTIDTPATPGGTGAGGGTTNPPPSTETEDNESSNQPSNKPNDYDMGHHSSFENNTIDTPATPGGTGAGGGTTNPPPSTETEDNESSNQPDDEPFVDRFDRPNNSNEQLGDESGSQPDDEPFVDRFDRPNNSNEQLGDGTETGDGTGTGSDGNAGDTAVTPSQPISREEWEELYGIDADAEYLNAKGALDYEFETWASEYGANAERLYQMGLSNSGVSDIYGSAAYSSYMKAAVELKKAQIEAKRHNKANYQSYVDTFNKTKEENVNKAYTYGLSLYDGTNVAHVQTMMENAGYDAETVQAAMDRIKEIDTSVYSSARVNEAFAAEIATYTGDENLIRAKYQQILPEEELDGLIIRLEQYWAAAAPNTTVSDQNNTLVIDLYTQYLDQYIKNGGDVNGNIETYIKNTYGENIASAVLDKLHTHDAANGITTTTAGDDTTTNDFTTTTGVVVKKETMESLVFAFVESFNSGDSVFDINYKGTYIDKLTKELKKLYDYDEDTAKEIATKAVDEGIKQMNKSTAIVESGTVNKFINEVQDMSFSEAVSGFESLDGSVSVDTSAAKTEVQNKAWKTYYTAFQSHDFSDVDDLEIYDDTDITTMEGNIIKWGDASVDEREWHLINRLVNDYNKGYVTEETFIYCLEKEMDRAFKEENADEGNKAAIALDHIMLYREWIKEGYISLDDYKSLADRIKNRCSNNLEIVNTVWLEGQNRNDHELLDFNLKDYEITTEYYQYMDDKQEESLRRVKEANINRGFVVSDSGNLFFKYDGQIYFIPNDLGDDDTWKSLYSYLLLTSYRISSGDEYKGSNLDNGNSSVMPGTGNTDKTFDDDVEVIPNKNDTFSQSVIK